MSTLSLRGRELMLARPADIEARVAAATGLSLAELRARLAPREAPSLLITALKLVTSDEISRGELGGLVDPTNMQPIVDAIAPLYAEEAPVHDGND